jgi:hypothetical protein
MSWGFQYYKILLDIGTTKHLEELSSSPVAMRPTVLFGFGADPHSRTRTSRPHNAEIWKVAAMRASHREQDTNGACMAYGIACLEILKFYNNQG